MQSRFGDAPNTTRTINLSLPSRSWPQRGLTLWQAVASACGLPLPPLRPRPSAYGVAGLRFGRGQ
jgi:hypothetical protein